jgi:16S rRNA A1518/A1519 N6-dimethyltransferase RsmA/KsgA/DIM1 with predicted DNA glycosylase/AP lyase activity
MSAVCLFRPRYDPALPAVRSDGFRAFVGRAFAQPRKTLSSNLSPVGLDRGRTEAILTAAGLPPDARPGRTPPEVLVELYRLNSEE